MVCEWFTWNPECDLPNWFTLIIEGLIGVGVTIYIFTHQRNEKKKKKRLALQRIADAYDMVYDQISVLETTEQEYQENISADPKNKDYQTNIEQSKKWRKITLENLQGHASNLDDSINLFSEDLDQGIKAITKFLVSRIMTLELPSDDKLGNWRFLDQVIEVNQHYDKILTNIKPNPRKDFDKSLETMSEYTDESGGLPWKDFMDHLYSGKLNKKNSNY